MQQILTWWSVVFWWWRRRSFVRKWRRRPLGLWRLLGLSIHACVRATGATLLLLLRIATLIAAVIAAAVASIVSAGTRTTGVPCLRTPLLHHHLSRLLVLGLDSIQKVSSQRFGLCDFFRIWPAS